MTRNTTRAIRALLALAADAASAGDPVPTDVAFALASEGYDLTALDADVERINANRKIN